MDEYNEIRVLKGLLKCYKMIFYPLHVVSLQPFYSTSDSSNGLFELRRRNWRN